MQRLAGVVLALTPLTTGDASATDCGFPSEISTQISQPWLVVSDEVFGRIFHDGAWATVAGPHGAARTTTGHDQHGEFVATTCSWTSGAVVLTTIVKRYPSCSATVYTLAFPDGAVRTNASVPGGVPSQHTKYGINTDSVAPFAEFPSFDLTQGRIANASWFTWVRARALCAAILSRHHHLYLRCCSCLTF
eukprot:COSAG02_NODE_4824_length_4936_cov_2.246640_3_plen_191_part_00